tara:strand:- start:1425 stop:2645 length:1221 start_codon:yes stop_codon:yes gene_type:complete
MNILIVSQYFWPEDFRINDLAKDFIEKGHDVTILTGSPNYPEGRTFPEYKKDKESFQNYGQIKIYRLPVIPRGTNKILLAMNYISFVISGILLAPFLLRKKSIDLIFVFEPSPITVCLPAILIKSIKKAKLCLWVLDLWPQSLYAVGYIKKESFIIAISRYMVRYIYSKCDIILGTSNSFVNEIKKDCRPDQVVKFFPNWYESFYESDHPLPAAEIKEDNKNFNLIFAGNLGDAQDIPTVIKGMLILKKNKNIKLFIIGDGKRYKWIKGFIDQNNLNETVILLGRFPSERMPGFFHHANAMVMSLKPHEVYDQTIPGKLQSYLISKKPILGLLGGESADIIKESNSGILSKPGDSISFANSILKIYNLEDSERHAIGINGFKYAKKNYNKDTLFSNLNSWLIEIIN